ncbi:unnamed protein product [Schistosoma turkestanicum]|nr:unnamed protein product [Schistosoma turkestanicum]
MEMDPHTKEIGITTYNRVMESLSTWTNASMLVDFFKIKEMDQDVCIHIRYWNNNIFHGNGILKMINGIKYEGEFKNGKPNGQGKLTRKTNLLPNYEGFWKDGLPCQAANHMKLSIESDKQHSKTNSACLMEYRNSPLDEKNYKFASFSKVEIASHELKTKCNIDVCIYSDSGKILIEGKHLFILKSNRQLALWIGKICKDNIQMRIPVDCQISVETPLLLSLKEKGIYTMQTPFGSRIYPVGSVTLISNKTVVDKDSSLVHSSTDDEDINHAVSNLTLNEEDNANQRLVNKIFVYKQFTNRGFTTYSIIKKSSINNDKNTNETIQTEHNIVDDLTSTPALDEDEYSIDLSQIEKSVLSFEEYINSSQLNPLQLDEQFILVVEDITPKNEEKDEEFHLDTIPDHILKTPERLSPLFIKLCYTSTK